jgi:hypothetical protein
VTVAEAEVVTAKVVTVKLAVVFPAEMVTLDGTLAMLVLLLESATTAPPDGAAELKVTTPCKAPPPTMLLWLRDNCDNETEEEVPDKIVKLPVLRNPL